MIPSTAPHRPDPTRARYETLLEVAESIAVHRQLSTLFADLSRLLKRLVPFDFISLTLIDPKERVVRLHILESEQPLVGKPPKSTPFEQTPTIAALESRRPYYIPDTAEESRFPVIRDLLRANGIQSACILPLFTAQREIGGLHFGSLTRNAYSEEDIEFMGQVARQVAVAVDNALNSEAAVAYEEQLAHERDRLRTLLEVNNAVVSCLETRELFQAISASLRRSFGLDYASLLIYDRRSRRPAPAHARFSGRHRRHPRGRDCAARRQPGGLRLPHPAGPRVQPGRGARRLGHHRRRCSSARAYNRSAASR